MRLSIGCILLAMSIACFVSCDEAPNEIPSPIRNVLTGTVIDSVSLSPLAAVGVFSNPTGSDPIPLGATDSLGYYNVFFFAGMNPRGVVWYELNGYKTKYFDATALAGTLTVFQQDVELVPE